MLADFSYIGVWYNFLQSNSKRSLEKFCFVLKRQMYFVASSALYTKQFYTSKIGNRSLVRDPFSPISPISTIAWLFVRPSCCTPVFFLRVCTILFWKLFLYSKIEIFLPLCLQLTFKCSGSSEQPPSSIESHVDPHTGVHLQEVTATISKDMVYEFFGKGAFKCVCHAWSPRGKAKSQPATVEVACKYLKKKRLIFLYNPLWSQK